MRSIMEGIRGLSFGDDVLFRQEAVTQQEWADEEGTCGCLRGMISNKYVPPISSSLPFPYSPLGLTPLNPSPHSPQVSDELKANVPDHIKEQAREMARAELARRLEELNMSRNEARGYQALYAAVETHVRRLVEVLESE